MSLIRNAADLSPLNSRSRRVLAIFPHPDDESYGPAGMLYRIGRDPDAATAVFIMTRGEASSMGPQKGLTPDGVADLRRGRLGEVDRLLGLDALLIGGFTDSGMAHQPLAEMKAAVTACLDAMQPQVVIVHDARGVNAHPDHISAHWAVRAALAERETVRLAMLAYPREMAEAIAPRLIFPTPEEEVDCVIHLDAAETEAKQACLEVHEAIVTLREDPDDERIYRPPVERFRSCLPLRRE